MIVKTKNAKACIKRAALAMHNVQVAALITDLWAIDHRLIFAKGLVFEAAEMTQLMV